MQQRMEDYTPKGELQFPEDIGKRHRETLFRPTTHSQPISRATRRSHTRIPPEEEEHFTDPDSPGEEYEDIDVERDVEKYTTPK